MRRLLSASASGEPGFNNSWRIVVTRSRRASGSALMALRTKCACTAASTNLANSPRLNRLRRSGRISPERREISCACAASSFASSDCPELSGGGPLGRCAADAIPAGAAGRSTCRTTKGVDAGPAGAGARVGRMMGSGSGADIGSGARVGSGCGGAASPCGGSVGSVRAAADAPFNRAATGGAGSCFTSGSGSGVGPMSAASAA